MRVVILLNPKKSVEWYKTADDFADASLGFDYSGAIDDNLSLAKHLREVADMLEAKTIPDSELL